MNITKLSRHTKLGKSLYSKFNPMTHGISNVNFKSNEHKSLKVLKEVPYLDYNFTGYLVNDTVYVTFGNYMLRGNKQLFTFKK